MIFAEKTNVVIEGESEFDGKDKLGNMLKHIYISSGSLDIADGSFFHNNYGTDGVSIYSIESDITIGKVRFEDNKSTQQTTCGTVYLEGGDLTLKGTTFKNNKNYAGGAICMYSSGSEDSLFTINDAIFEKNIADYGGGAIYLNKKQNYNLKPELRIKSAVFKENQSSGVSGGEGGAIYATSHYNVEGWKIYMSRAVFAENTGASVGGAIALFDASHLEILPRNGAVIFGNKTVSSPVVNQDIYANVRDYDTYNLSETMFNGYDFGWEENPVDFSDENWNYSKSGMVINANPAGRSYSGADVVFEKNSSVPGRYTLNASGAITLDIGSQLIIGEEAADEFKITKIWDKQVVDYDLTKKPEDFMAMLRLFANGVSYELGKPVQVGEKTTGTDGKDHYLFSFTDDPGTFASLEDAHDDKYVVTFKTLPKYIDGTEATYSVSEVTDGDYLPEVEGFELTNKLNPYNDPLPVRVVWNDNNNAHGKRPAPEDYISLLILYINGEAADWGNISLIEKITDDGSGTVTYRFTAENMPGAVLRLVDAENNTYEITLEQLPRFIEGERPVYTVGQQSLLKLNYQTDIEVSDGITVIRDGHFSVLIRA